MLLDGLSFFGLLAVTAMMVCYAFENKNHYFTLGFAVACAAGSVYGFLQGAWPFGIVEIVWSVVALRKWQLKVAKATLKRGNNNGTSKS